MKPKKKMCAGYITALRAVTEHTRKEFAKIDAENAKLDQMEMFNEQDTTLKFKKKVV